MSTYTLSGLGQTYTSSVQPVFDADFRAWRCANVAGEPFNVTDRTGDTFTIAASMVTTVIKAVLWYNCFQPAEARAIKGSTDPEVQEFYFRLSQMIAAGETLDTSTASVQEGVAYLSTVNQQPAVSPPAPYVQPSRVPDILAGLLQ